MLLNKVFKCFLPPAGCLVLYRRARTVHARCVAHSFNRDQCCVHRWSLPAVLLLLTAASSAG
jgi:hypothetical protein